jgi:hypothetical protein
MLVEKLLRLFPVKVYSIETVIFFSSEEKERTFDGMRKQLSELFCRLALCEQGVCGPVSSFLLK